MDFNLNHKKRHWLSYFFDWPKYLLTDWSNNGRFRHLRFCFHKYDRDDSTRISNANNFWSKSWVHLDHIIWWILSIFICLNHKQWSATGRWRKVNKFSLGGWYVAIISSVKTYLLLAGHSGCQGKITANIKFSWKVAVLWKFCLRSSYHLRLFSTSPVLSRREVTEKLFRMKSLLPHCASKFDAKTQDQIGGLSAYLADNLPLSRRGHWSHNCVCGSLSTGCSYA